MTKFMNRKGLALGAAFALVATGLVAAPASAAGEISLAVNGGTGTSTILGESFSLKATVGSLVPDSSNDEVTFLVANATGATLTYTADAGQREVGVDDDSIETTVVDGTGVAATGTSSGVADYVKGGFTQDGDRSVITTAEAYLDNQTLSISSAATAAHSVTVTAWLDADGSGTINNGEFASSPVTISFVEYDDAGLQVAMKSTPQLGDGTFTAKVTSSVINVAQVAVGNIAVQAGVYVSGTAIKADATGTYVYGTYADTAIGANGNAVTLSATTGDLETGAVSVSFTDAGAVARTVFTAGSYVAQAIYATDQDGTDWAVVGTELAFGLGAAEADAAESEESVTVVAGSVSASGAVIKGYTGNITYVVNVKDSDEENLAGVITRLTVTTETGTFTVNGAAVASGGKYDATTDANGNATFVFVSANGAATDALAIGAITAEGVTVVADGTDIAYAASTWVANETTPGATSQASDVVRSADAGSTVSLSFAVTDQWGNAFANSLYRMKAAVTGRTVTTLTDVLGDGVATFAITDGANAANPATVTLSYEKLASGVWGTSTDIAAVSARSVYWYSQTNKVTIVESSETARVAQKATKAGDTRLGLTATVFTTGTGDKAADANTVDNSEEKITLTGSVTNSVTAGKQLGSLITVSGDASLLFNVNGVYAFGSLTYFDADGDFSINVYSNKAQTDSIVTITTADGGSDTVKVTFDGVSTAAGDSLVITAPDAVLPGSTLQIVGTLSDVFGNGVNTTLAAAVDYNEDNDTTDAGETTTAFKVTVTGPGISLVNLPATTDAAGQFTVNRLLGVNETAGTIVVTASYDQNDDGDYADANDIVVSKSIVVGSASAIVASWTKNLNDGTVKMYAKNIVGAGKVQFMLNGEEIAWVRATTALDSKLRTANGASYLVRTVDLVEGQKNVLEIYVDGVRTARSAYSY